VEHKFGWGLPPGVSDWMIEEQAGAFGEEKMKHPKWVDIELQSDGTFFIWVQKKINLELGWTPDHYEVANAKELLEFLKDIYGEE